MTSEADAPGPCPHHAARYRNVETGEEGPMECRHCTPSPAAPERVEIALARRLRALAEDCEATDGWEGAASDVVAAARFIENTRTPSEAVAEVDDETATEIAVVERARIVAWLRDQSNKGADIALGKDKSTTARAAYGGGSYALLRAADEIEADAHHALKEQS